MSPLEAEQRRLKGWVRNLTREPVGMDGASLLEWTTVVADDRAGARAGRESQMADILVGRTHKVLLAKDALIGQSCNTAMLDR